MDRVYIATNVNFNTSQNADRDLNRYEFLEILLRLAIVKYKDTNICSSFTDALQKLLYDNVFPNIEESNPRPFREMLYNNLVSELFLRNEQGIKRLFGIYIHG